MQRFGEKLRFLREQNNLTMRELAVELDLKSHGSVGDLELGRAKPSTTLVVRVADLFDVTTDQLLRDELEV
ncbi:helix-turn-helix transcriptional regulator [Anaerolineales bacterium HSG25]|nr:helix-turn-helix transcriptional regulator [Anaerolineales bacterium HSG25]